MVPSARTRGSGHKVEHRMFVLNTRKHFFTVWVDEAVAQVAQRGFPTWRFPKLPGRGTRFPSMGVPAGADG